MTADGSRAGRGMTIGVVLDALREEFPDVTISKIRFLESQGLVTPARRGSGYRIFSESDVDRLRFILRAQRDKFWPLRVIAEALDAMDRGLESGLDDAEAERPSVPTTTRDKDLPTAADVKPSVKTLRLTPEEICRATGMEAAAFESLVMFGLVKAGPDGHYSAAALDVAREAAALSEFGLEPRHLRSFRMAADREVGLVQQVMGPMRGHRGSADKVNAVETELLARCLGLHVALVKQALSGPENER